MVSSSRLTRRRLIVAGLASVSALGVGGVLIETGTIPGRGQLNRRLGLQPPVSTPPTTAVGPMRSGQFTSLLRGGVETSWMASWPPGSRVGDRLPVLIVLHGFGGTARSVFAELHLDRYLGAAMASGVRPFAVASVDGGNGYWHQRNDFGDSGAMVTEEFLPVLHRLALRTDAFGLLGWSMGGYGALLIGGALGPKRVPVIVAESPALWTSVAKRNPEAFDSSEDYVAHDVWSRRSTLSATAVRIDCGADDAFCPAVRSFVKGMDPKPAGGFPAGNHDPDFWMRMAPAQLSFVGQHLRP